MIRLTGDWPRQVQEGATQYLIDNYEFFSAWNLEKIDDLIDQIYDAFSQETTEDIQSVFEDDNLIEDRETLISMCVQLEALQTLREMLLANEAPDELPPVGLKHSRKNIRRIK